MNENELNQVQCEQIKNYIKSLIDSIPCEKIIDDDSFRKKTFVGKPISDDIASFNSSAFQNYFGNVVSNQIFEIEKEEINYIVEENTNRDYLHVFFVNEEIHSVNKLNLAFRFSDIKIFKKDTLDLNPKNEAAYWLRNRKAVKFTGLDGFTDLNNNYKNGIGQAIANSPNTKLTEYVTFDMSDILLFQGFEHDLKFELMAVNENKLRRISIQVKVKDTQRIHTLPNKYEGYYDFGNIRP